MISSEMGDSGVRMQLHLKGKEWSVVVPEDRVNQVRHVGRAIWRAPFSSETWRELSFFLVAGLLEVVSLVFIGVTMVAGVILVVTFVGLFLIGASVRGARGMGSWHRNMARRLLQEDIDEPEPFSSRPGVFGWLQATLRDRTGWRTIAYVLVKVPVVIFGVWFALGTWVAAASCLTYPLWQSGAPGEFGFVRQVFPPGYFDVGTRGFWHGLFIFLTGVLLLFVAPWTMRVVVLADRWLMRGLLSPDAVTARLRALEKSRAQTVDSSAATLRRIERDLHDGTQAQLVALAMRLGQAKDKLAADSIDLDQVRRLVDEAHSGAKEAIVELRDLARGIHPPVLDVGLEGALSSLAAKSVLPTELSLSIQDRPTPAIEAIGYFCVAELLANSAQHAHASRAGISCVQHGKWLRIVVRDDGRGGAQVATVGSSSSGLKGLQERVEAVDGNLAIASPIGGPTVVTVDLPLQA
jgi:signal transduction histidine kinase